MCRRIGSAIYHLAVVSCWSERRRWWHCDVQAAAAAAAAVASGSMPGAEDGQRAGPTVANSNFVLFVFFVAACAIYLRDLGSSTGLILVAACVAADFRARS